MLMNPKFKMCAVALSLTCTCIVAESAPKVAEPAQKEFRLSAQTIRLVEKDHSAHMRKGDIRLWGIPGRPARLESPSLSLSGVLIQLATNREGIVAVSRGSELVKLKSEITPTKGGLPVHFEATCEQAVFNRTNGSWSLEGDVKGFYETADGRKPFKSEIVTISRLKSQISVTQQVTDNVTGSAGA